MCGSGGAGIVCVRADSDSGTQCSVVGALDSSDVGCVLVVCLVQLHYMPVALACCCRHTMLLCVCMVLCRCAADSRDSRSLCSSVQ